MSVKEKIERIIELLHEADALQQEVVQDNKESYSIHNKLTDLAADFEERLENNP